MQFRDLFSKIDKSKFKNIMVFEFQNVKSNNVLDFYDQGAKRVSVYYAPIQLFGSTFEFLSHISIVGIEKYVNEPELLREIASSIRERVYPIEEQDFLDWLNSGVILNCIHNDYGLNINILFNITPYVEGWGVTFNTSQAETLVCKTDKLYIGFTSFN